MSTLSRLLHVCTKKAAYLKIPKIPRFMARLAIRITFFFSVRPAIKRAHRKFRKALKIIRIT